MNKEQKDQDKKEESELNSNLFVKPNKLFRKVK